ncbi:MAG TPA: hypothetical protein VJX73_03720 [Terracidiphilus sp.]|nr:hypothetical protein [Terracidiphilus sp.]
MGDKRQKNQLQMVLAFTGEGRSEAPRARREGTESLTAERRIESPVILQFVPVTPCCVVDRRKPNGEFGGPSLQGGTPRFFVIPDNQDCMIPSSAARAEALGRDDSAGEVCLNADG